MVLFEKKRIERMVRASSSVKSNLHAILWMPPPTPLLNDFIMSKNEQPDLLDVASFRRDYLRAEMRRANLHPDPMAQFHCWLAEAESATTVLESTAMVLSTASSAGEVTSRIVLLKGYDERGFRFFTNTGSLKASQIKENQSVSLLFYWESLERQIQISGIASSLPLSETEVYFANRPRGSRIGAWASHQSKIIPDRETLDRRASELEKQFTGKEVPTPPFWGGYVVAPSTIEFWQGRANRLHDRFRYRKDDNRWVIERLSP